MKINRRSMLRIMLFSPIAVLGVRLEAKAHNDYDKDKAITAACCFSCDHYVFPRHYDFVTDGTVPAHCCHLSYCGDLYLYEDLIIELNLFRRPDDSCSLFTIKRGLKI